VDFPAGSAITGWSFKPHTPSVEHHAPSLL
jgi:hypothetical protein